MRANTIGVCALSSFGEQIAFLESAARPRDAGLGIDDQVVRIDLVDNRQKRNRENYCYQTPKPRVHYLSLNIKDFIFIPFSTALGFPREK